MSFIINPFRFGAPASSVWDPSRVQTGTTLSNANATATITAAVIAVAGTQGRTSAQGPRSFNVTIAGSGSAVVGIGTSSGVSGGLFPGANSNGIGYVSDARKFNNNTGVSYGATFGAGDVIGVVLAANGDVAFYKNGVSQGVTYNIITLGFSSSSVWFAMFGAASGATSRSGTIDTSATVGFSTAWG